MISRSLLAQLAAEAGASGEEICGLILQPRNGGISLLRCANVHPQPAARFELDPVALLAAHRAARASGDAVIGHYHSHPSGDAMPSLTDAASAAPDGAVWLIVGRGGEARAWRAVHDGAVHGRFDPLAIVAD